jgi:hypothetical protein
MAKYIPTNFAPRLYIDWYLLINKLSAEKQAEIMRAIFEYPNYTPDNIDCWDFLSSRLKDQYERFLSNKQKRTEAAKKGAASRWGNDSIEKKDDIFTGLPEFISDILTGKSAPLDSCDLDSESRIIYEKLNPYINKYLTNPTIDKIKLIDSMKDILSKNITNTNIKITKKNNDLNNDFEEFWKEYTPVKCNGRVIDKGSKVDSLKKYILARKTDSAENIISGLKIYLEKCEKNKILTCGVSVFLNQKRWINEPCSVIITESKKNNFTEFIKAGENFLAKTGGVT